MSREVLCVWWVSNWNGERFWEVRGVSLWLHLFETYWALGVADAPFEITQRPPGGKPRAAAELSTAQGMGQRESFCCSCEPATETLRVFYPDQLFWKDIFIAVQHMVGSDDCCVSLWQHPGYCMFSFSGVALIGPSGRNCDVDCTSLVSGSLNNLYLSSYQTATVPASLGSSHIREQILKTGLSLTVMPDGGIKQRISATCWRSVWCQSKLLPAMYFQPA